MTQDELFKVLVAHCKEYGFIFPSSEIYDGLAAVYDYGQMGVELKNNIKRYWWEAMTRLNENVVGIDSCVFMHPKTWVASGHVAAFNDPLIDNKDSKKRYRADNLIEDYLGKIEEKIEKEVAKGRKKFGDAFNEEQFRATNPRPLQGSGRCQRPKGLQGHNHRLRNRLPHFRNRQLDRGASVQPHVQHPGLHDRQLRRCPLSSS